jgi:Cu(I)/Ag(I) efflux system membrane fusion protein
VKNKTMLAPLFAIAIAIIISATAYVAYRFGVRQGGTVAPPAAMGNDKKPLYWHDPMVPGQKFDKPGKSPFMDMQLVPVYAGAGEDDGGVAISARVRQNLGVRTATVTAGRLPSGMIAVGSVAYDERAVALVEARSNGFVEQVYVRAPLDPVKQGQPLAELYVPDWIAAQEDYLAARRMEGGDTAPLIDGARQRMRLAGMTEEQIRLVQASGEVHPRMTVSAPIGGVIAQLGARQGMSVAPGAPLFRINGRASVWINADIPESQAGKVRPGDAVEARVAALPGSVFKGRVGAVLPEVNAATRTLKARIELGNPGGALMPGMFATIAFASGRGAEALLVPSEAVIHTGRRSVVMLAQDGGSFQPVDVEPGEEADGMTEIRKGLAAGQKIVVSGQFLLDSEASLKGAENRMAAPPQSVNDRPMVGMDAPQAAGATK